MTLSMKAEIKERWLKALRSGEFRQGAGELHTLPKPKSDGTEWEERFCCLGVLSHLCWQDAGIEREAGVRAWRYGNSGEVSYLPQEVIAWAGLEYEGEREFAGSTVEETRGTLDLQKDRVLTRMNDSGLSFEHIAETIEDEVIGI